MTRASAGAADVPPSATPTPTPTTTPTPVAPESAGSSATDRAATALSAIRVGRGAGEAPSSTVEISVIVATYNRTASVVELLSQLAGQTLAADRFEVIVVDDGSREPAQPRLAALDVPYALLVLTQANAGPAAARHAGIVQARGAIVLTLDDDMRVRPDFLARHLAAHAGRSHHVVLGRLRPPGDAPLALFERYQLAQVDKLAREVAQDPARLRGSHLYTGNVSFARADYLRVGGFDPAFRISEDAELGIRLEAAGATFAFSEEAEALHASDHTRLATWMRRSEAYGVADAMVSDKHLDRPSANPWRFLFLVNPVSRPLLLASAVAPRLMKPVAWLAARLSQAVAALGLERAAMAGMTLTYGMQYFRGLHGAPPPPAGPPRFQRFLNATGAESLGVVGKFAKCWADVRADHAMLRGADDRYGSRPMGGSVLGDAVQRIGFQMMVAYRVMRLLRALRLGILARIWSRVMRHLYAADIHWDAQLAPGVVIVHGTGLVISHAARVGPGCILFQHVTLGESIHARSRQVGAPTLGANVHVGPGATLLGPIEIGEGSKITASALVMDSIPAHSLVETPAPLVRPRGGGRRPGPAGTAAAGDPAPGASAPEGAGADETSEPSGHPAMDDGMQRPAREAPTREEEG